MEKSVCDGGGAGNNFTLFILKISHLFLVTETCNFRSTKAFKTGPGRVQTLYFSAFLRSQCMGFGSRLQRVFGAPIFGQAELKGAFLDCYGLFLFDYEINGPKK